MCNNLGVTSANAFLPMAIHNTDSTPAARVRYQHAHSTPLGRITEAGHIEDSLGPQGWRTLNAFALVFTVSGHAVYEEPGREPQPLEPGCVLLLRPGVSHTYGPRDSVHQWHEYYVVFDGLVFDLWRRQGMWPNDEPCKALGDVGQWLPRFEAVTGPIEHDNLGLAQAYEVSNDITGDARALVEVCRLQTLLAAILTVSPPSVTPKFQQQIRQACRQLENDHTQTLDLMMLARSLGVSYEVFRKRFTQVVGMPPGRYRAARLMDQACARMRASDSSDKEIAESLGFCDPFHFSRRFKHIVGCSPREFRRRASRQNPHA